MHKLLRMAAVLAAATLTSTGHAGVIDFDTPTIIDIDNTSGVATYREDGVQIQGQAASFLTIDGLGTNASPGLFLVGGETIVLTAMNGSLFSFMGLDGASLDSATGATLNLTGLFGDNSTLMTSVTLSELSNFTFSGLMGISELRISASADVILDNLLVAGTEVPEPNTAATLLLGAGLLFGMRRRVKVRNIA